MSDGNPCMFAPPNRFAAFSRPWLANFAMEPDWMAPVGQISSHALGISKGLSFPGVWQKLHFSIFPAEADNCGALKGHAHAQKPQPMHLFGSTTTIPSSARFVIAVTGQAVRQGASPQCMQAMDTFIAFTLGKVPLSTLTTSRQRGPTSTSFQVLQAISHAWHFTQ